MPNLRGKLIEIGASFSRDDSEFAIQVTGYVKSNSMKKKRGLFSPRRKKHNYRKSKR